VSIGRCERPHFDTLGMHIYCGDSVPENIWLLLDMPDAACDRHFGFERSECVPACKASMSLDSQLQKITRHIVSSTVGLPRWPITFPMQVPELPWRSLGWWSDSD
jgi:hypothetical protein